MIPQRVGRYEIKSELGRGGMATVYRAHDPSFEREVAVKVLPRELLHDPQFRARFEREAKTIAALEHPAIVPVYDFGEDNGQPYLVMRYMPGGSLTDRLKPGPLPLAETARIFNQLADALDEAHSKGLIHRDLKPSNILFDQRENAYISDFGIVKVSDASVAFTGTGIVGTPAYMSPEQAKAATDLDKRSDIYSLGAILYEMLTGRLPYESNTPLGMAMAHITEPVPRVLEARADLPPACQTVIDKAMAKERRKRFATASALAKAVSNLAGVEAPPQVDSAATILEPQIDWRATEVEPRAAPTPSRVVPTPSRVAPTPSRAVPTALPELPVEKRGAIPTWGWAVGCLLVVVLIGGALLLGGGGALLLAGRETPTPLRTFTPVPSATPLPLATAPPTPAIVMEATAVVRGTAIVLFNTGTADICAAYVAPTAQDTWGDNMLAVSLVRPGESHSFEVTAGVSYDLRADDCQRRNVDEMREVSLAQDQQYRWAVVTGSTGVARVTLVNKGSADVCFVNYSLSSSDTWGNDRLGTEAVISSGNSVTFEIAEVGQYDFRALDCNRNSLGELYKQQIYAGDNFLWNVGP